MAEPFTIYKLTVLYLLDMAVTPLSNTQITNFFLEQDYTDYFNVQEALSELQDFDLVTARSTHRSTRYLLTGLGKNTLRLSLDKLNDTIRADVNAFLQKNRVQIREENSRAAYFYRTAGMKYAANCRLYSDDEVVLDLTVTVGTKAQAEAVCANWELQSQEIYGELLGRLVR